MPVVLVLKKLATTSFFKKFLKAMVYFLFGLLFLMYALYSHLMGILNMSLTGGVTKGGWQSFYGQVDPPLNLIPLFVNVGTKNNIPWQFLATINKIETNYGHSTSEISSAGALGPMQFMPTTWDEYGVGSPFNYVDAVNASGKMFRVMGMSEKTTLPSQIQRFAGSYNAGASNWGNLSTQTTDYREKATIYFYSIASTVVIPKELINYWDGLTNNQLQLMVNKKMSIYPSNYKGKRVYEGVVNKIPGLPTSKLAKNKTTTTATTTAKTKI